MAIRRRDFLNGMLLAAGGAAVSSFFPHALLADEPAGPDSDPRLRRGGNLPEVFTLGHWLRDHRLRFDNDKVELLPDSDGRSGRFDIAEAGETYDTIVVGAGMAGLSAAYFVRAQHPNAKVLVLDAQAEAGGNAGVDKAAPLPCPASTGASYALKPTWEVIEKFYAGIGVRWQEHVVPDPLYSYFFDDRAPHVRAGSKLWNIDTYGKGFSDVPYAPEILRDLVRAREDLKRWSALPGGPTDPADESKPAYDGLAVQSFADYLKEKAFHPAVADFFTRYSVDALGGAAAHVSAHSAISFLGAEFSSLFAFPVVNHQLVERSLTSLRGRPGVRMLPKAMALRADDDAQGASVVYVSDGKFVRARAKAVVLAGQSHTARHLVTHLLDDAQRKALGEATFVPVVVANVAVRKAAPIADLGYDAYYWGSQYWADFVVADWVGPARQDPSRPTVLTFFGGNDKPPDRMAEERYALLTTPFGVYERSLKEDLGRVLGGRDFEFERDVSAIFLYRWGHGMIFPKVGWVFAEPVDGKRAPCARHLARKSLGRIAIGAQDVEGNPSIESAVSAGWRTAREALAWL